MLFRVTWPSRVALTCGVAGLITVTSVYDSEARSRRSERSRKNIVQVATAPVAAVPPTVAPSLVETPAKQARDLREKGSTPLVAAVSLSAQTVTIYQGTTVVARSPISSGMTGYATPTGVFSIIQKARYHESNIYDNAPMPFMQRLTWSGVALHAGKLPGYPASHGCVRLPYDFAERLFGQLRMGTRVVVAPEVVTPMPIVHAALPKPIFTQVPLLAQAQSTGSYLTLASVAPGSDAPRFEPADTQLLNPPQYAEHEKRRALLALAANQNDARRLLDDAARSAATADEARAERLRVEREITSFRSLLDRARGQRDKATDDEARGQADASIAAFQDAIIDADEAIGRMAEVERQLLTASFTDARAARAAEDAVERADAAVKMAARGGEPITVFVSRAEGRVLVRQGFHTILEGEVQIRDPHLPLGTHVLTAGAPFGNGDELSWTGLSVSDAGIRAPSASDALSRITLDADVTAAIGRRIWSGATMLISDQPASKETGKGTDFVILTK